MASMNSIILKCVCMYSVSLRYKTNSIQRKTFKDLLLKKPPKVWKLHAMSCLARQYDRPYTEDMGPFDLAQVRSMFLLLKECGRMQLRPSSVPPAERHCAVFACFNSSSVFSSTSPSSSGNLCQNMDHLTHNGPILPYAAHMNTQQYFVSCTAIPSHQNHSIRIRGRLNKN